jgi:hypothetical protein
LVPPPCTAGHAAWHSASVVHEPQVPPPLLELLLPLSTSPPLLLPELLVLPLLLPELLVLPLLLVLLPELLVLLPPSWVAPPSPKSNPFEVESP